MTTDRLVKPVPVTVMLVSFEPAKTDMGDIDESVGTGLLAETITVVVPDLDVSCVEVAVTVAVPADVGVKTPVLLTVPILVGLTDHKTELLKLPVPVTVGVQVDV